MPFEEAWNRWANAFVGVNQDTFREYWDSLPDKADAPVDPAELRMAEDVGRGKVLRASLGLASTHFAQEAADPGWDADYQEDNLRDAVCEYADAIRARREFEGGAK